MLAMRGAKTAAPCPVCTVPSEQLWDLTLTFPRRSKAETLQILATAEGMGSVTARNCYLQEHGLKTVKVSV
jgi:hypothetical protein